MKTFRYKCKFCGKPGTVDGDEKGLAFIGDVNKWLGMIACRRCATFIEQKRKVTDALARICRDIEVKRPAKLESKHREDLERLTKRLCGLSCTQYGLMNVWDNNLPELMFKNPDCMYTIVGTYLRKLETESKQNHDTHRKIQPDVERNAADKPETPGT